MSSCDHQHSHGAGSHSNCDHNLNHAHTPHQPTKHNHNHSHNTPSHSCNFHHDQNYCEDSYLDADYDKSYTNDSDAVQISSAKHYQTISHLSSLSPDFYLSSNTDDPNTKLFSELSARYSQSSSIFHSTQSTQSTQSMQSTHSLSTIIRSISNKIPSFSFPSVLIFSSTVSILRAFLTITGFSTFHSNLNNVIQLFLFASLWLSCWYMFKYYSPVLSFGRYLLQHKYEKAQSSPQFATTAARSSHLQDSSTYIASQPLPQVSTQSIIEIDRKLTIFKFFVFLFLLFTLLVGFVEDFHSLHDTSSISSTYFDLPPNINVLLTNDHSPQHKIHHPHLPFHQLLQSHVYDSIRSIQSHSNVHNLFIDTNPEIAIALTHQSHSHSHTDNRDFNSSSVTSPASPASLTSPTSPPGLLHIFRIIPFFITSISIIANIILLLLTYPYSSHLLSIDPLSKYTQATISPSNLTIPHWYFGFFHPKQYLPTTISTTLSDRFHTQSSYFATFYHKIYPTHLSTPTLKESFLLKISSILQYTLEIFKLHPPMDLFATTMYSIGFYLALFIFCKEASALLSALQNHIFSSITIAISVFNYNNSQSASSHPHFLYTGEGNVFSLSVYFISSFFPSIIIYNDSQPFSALNSYSFIPNSSIFPTITPNVLATILPTLSTTFLLFRLFLSASAFYWVLYPCMITFTTLLRATSQTNAMDIALLLHELTTMVETHFTPLLQSFQTPPDPSSSHSQPTKDLALLSPTEKKQCIVEFVYQNRLTFKRAHSWRLSHNITIASLCMTMPHIPLSPSSTTNSPSSPPKWVVEIIRHCIHQSSHLFTNAMLLEEQPTNIVADPLE